MTRVRISVVPATLAQLGERQTEDLKVSRSIRESRTHPVCSSRCSIVVSIPACHAGDPGSIPGNGARPSWLRHPRQGSNLRPIA